MTATQTQSKATITSARNACAKKFFGISSKDFVAIAQARKDVNELSQMAAWAHANVQDLTAQGKPSRVAKWQRALAKVTERIQAVSSGPAITGAVTFVDAPVAKRKRAKSKSGTKGRVVAGVNISAMSASDRTALLLALSASV